MDIYATVDREALVLVGDRVLVNNMKSWLGLSPFAAQEKLTS